MRLIELEIKNIRGIKDLTLEPNGENLLVWGPNGSGKSGVVDAIDFLLTGDISRLTGVGTGDITLNRHGKHIDNDDLRNSRVRAVVELPFSHERVELVRRMDRTGVLEFPEHHKQEIEKILSCAIRGQHVLTRREILKYITAESKTRAVQIQLLLNLSQVENIRSSLTSVTNSCNRAFEESKRNLISYEDRIKEIISEREFSEGIALIKINNYREILNAQPINSIKSTLLKSEITHLQSTPTGKTVSISNFTQDIDNIKSIQTAEIKKIIDDEKEVLVKAIDEINSSPTLIETLKREKLIELGLELIDESGSCPLCDTEWEQGELKEYLTKKQEDIKTAQTIIDKMKSSTFNLIRIIDKANSSIQRVLLVIEEYGELKKAKEALMNWRDILDEIHSMLADYTELHKKRDFILEKLNLLILQTELIVLLKEISEKVKKNIPESSPEHDAWDNLTRLEGYLRDYESAKTVMESNDLLNKRAILLLNKFIESRDHILSDLYKAIQGKFVELYRHLHGPDEDDFDAELKPEEAGLYIGVDFYGRGKHPPHALHSEGHQDSMGLCLYLALSERLNQDIIDLIILDDVVMSVDSDHRKNVCSLLKQYYSDKQLIITTHDKTWANQIKYGGVVKSNQCIEFYNWDIDSGPKVKNLQGMWERIENHLKNGDVKNAAFELRNGSEEYFAEVCNSLRAEIRFDMQGKNDFGEFLIGASSQYKKLIRTAKRVAESWKNQDNISNFDELESTRIQISKRLGGEQWAVNVIIHFNTWENFTVNDFRPVVEAFQDLFGMYKCQICGDLIRLIVDDRKKEQEVRCNCKKINWNLIPKPEDN